MKIIILHLLAGRQSGLFAATGSAVAEARLSALLLTTRKLLRGHLSFNARFSAKLDAGFTVRAGHDISQAGRDDLIAGVAGVGRLVWIPPRDSRRPVRTMDCALRPDQPPGIRRACPPVPPSRAANLLRFLAFTRPEDQPRAASCGRRLGGGGWGEITRPLPVVPPFHHYVPSRGNPKT